MCGQDRQLAPRALFEGIGTRDSAPEAAGELMSALIIAYEQALEAGISPAAVLAAALDWVSLEIQRHTSLHHSVE
jgi:hypothetical protein